MHILSKLTGWGALATLMWTIGCSDAASSPDWARDTSADNVRRDAGPSSVVASPSPTSPSSSTPPSPTTTPPVPPTSPLVVDAGVDAAPPVQIDLSAKGVVTRAYLLALERAPDAAGLAFFVQKVVAGTPRLEILAALVTSSEFATHYAALTDDQFVTTMYQRFLHRAPEPAGLAVWLSALASGQSRGSLANDIIHGAEFARPSNPEHPFFF